jgi:chitinase
MNEMKPARLLIAFFLLASASGFGQGTAPTFRFNTANGVVTLPGRDPSQGGTTVIPTVLVPVRLHFLAPSAQNAPTILDAAADVPRLLHSPVFSKVALQAGETTQYLDAMLRATTNTAAGYHTLLGTPQVHAVTVEIPPGYGYMLSSKRTGTRLGMADVEYVQREIFRQIPRQEGNLVIAVTHNTAFYTYGDATVCCTWGMHGVDPSTGNSFVLASYLGATPPLVEERDIQPLTGQLAEWANDPLHDPFFHIDFRTPLPAGENKVPRWQWPSAGRTEHRGCGGDSPATRYTLQDPLDTNERSQLPAGPALVVHTGAATWHVANVALMGWYTAGAKPYSFPDNSLLQTPATPCAVIPRAATSANELAPPSAVPTAPHTEANNGHELIGYWTGDGPGGTLLRLRDISPQWDVIIVAFANVDHHAPEGTMQMHVHPPRPGQPPMDLAQFKEDIARLKSQGKKVLISLGGGGEYFTLAQQASIPNFVNSVSRIVTEYGFDGIDIDFETPSLDLDPGDTDFRHPKTASIVNLISALRELRERLGPAFMLSLVPEGTQIPAGYAGYGGQFGTYLPLLWGVRDILSFVDVQDYNTPPLQGLDGEIYQLGSVNYDAAMTELVLHGFPVGGPTGESFPPVRADKVAVGFLVGTATPTLVSQAMQYLITGAAPARTEYKLRQPMGYPAMIGAMFWTIDGDRNENYSFSNSVGPQLHGYSAAKRAMPPATGGKSAPSASAGTDTHKGAE